MGKPAPNGLDTATKRHDGLCVIGPMGLFCDSVETHWAGEVHSLKPDGLVRCMLLRPNGHLVASL